MSKKHPFYYFSRIFRQKKHSFSYFQKPANFSNNDPYICVFRTLMCVPLVVEFMLGSRWPLATLVQSLFGQDKWALDMPQCESRARQIGCPDNQKQVLGNQYPACTFPRPGARFWEVGAWSVHTYFENLSLLHIRRVHGDNPG